MRPDGLCYPPRVLRPAAALLAALAALALAPRASAQSASELAAARSLFEEGLAAAREGRWDEARQRFERSYEIAPRPTTLLNLAGAQVQTGRLVAGAESYRRFLSEARRGREARYRRQAQQALAEVEPRLGRLIVRVEGVGEEDTILLDGVELARAALGVGVPVDPGRRTLVVRRGDADRAREVVTVAEGEEREVTLRAVALRVPATAADRSSAPAAALRGDPEPSAAGGDDSGVVIGIAVSVGVLVAAGVAIGVGLAVDAASAAYVGNLGPGTIQFD